MSHARLIRILLTILFGFLELRAAHAASLDYSTRTRDFSSWTAATRGDINTVGMGGATLAIPSSIAAAEANSAGYAMQTGSLSAQINQITLRDPSIQRSHEKIESGQWGLAVSPSPWGFGIASYSSMTEKGRYEPLGGGAPLNVEVALSEVRMTVARSFFESRLALGLSMGVIHATRKLNGEAFGGSAVGFQLGALYRLPYRVILGARVVPEVRVGPNSDASSAQSLIPGFNRAVIQPAQVGIGVGWVPNRFFKAGASMNYIASTQDTALLASESVLTGSVATLVPRAGASYVFAEYRHFKLEGAIGGYFEPARLSDQTHRFHRTAGLEANPYFINLGVGIDIAERYRNAMVSVGIDLVRTLRTFAIIPKDPVPPYNGILPPMFRLTPDGLPGGLTGNEKNRYPQPSVSEVGKIVSEIPEKIADKFSGDKKIGKPAKKDSPKRK